MVERYSREGRLEVLREGLFAENRLTEAKVLEELAGSNRLKERLDPAEHLFGADQLTEPFLDHLANLGIKAAEPPETQGTLGPGILSAPGIRALMRAPGAPLHSYRFRDAARRRVRRICRIPVFSPQI
jgi:hypothetical protein